MGRNATFILHLAGIVDRQFPVFHHKCSSLTVIVLLYSLTNCTSLSVLSSMAFNTLGPDAEKQGGESFRWAGKLHCVKSRVWKYIKNALLSVVIVIVVLLLFLPTILYHLPILSVYLKTKYFLGPVWDKSVPQKQLGLLQPVVSVASVWPTNAILNRFSWKFIAWGAFLWYTS